MNGAPAAALSETSFALLAMCILLVPLAGAGLAVMNTGLGRSRSASHAMLASLSISGVAVLAYFFCGFAWQGFAGRASHVLVAGGREWSWAGAGRLFFGGFQLDGSPVSLAAWLGMFSVAIAAVIPLGAALERWRLGAACASTALLAGFVYPVFAHWVWGGGWLAQLGANRGLGRGFLDAGGASCIQTVGGLAALSMTWILRPRRGKYTSDGMPAAIPGHNGVLMLFACFLTLVGWLGLNAGGAILYTGAPAGAIVLAAVNTMLSAAMAGLGAACVTRFRFGRPDASLCANGWVGGLVASSAGCVFLVPAAAALVGLVAGVLVALSVEWLDLYLEIDDPGGSVSVHALAGIWGLLAVGLLGRVPHDRAINGVAGAVADGGQTMAQIVGIAALLGFVLPAVYGLNRLLNRFYPQRVSTEGEWQGMDLHELGAGAYPEFVIHRDDFVQR